MMQTSEKLMPEPKLDAVGPPIPPEAPAPEVEPSLPQPGPDVFVPPGPEVTTPPHPQEIPPDPGESG